MNKKRTLVALFVNMKLMVAAKFRPPGEGGGVKGRTPAKSLVVRLILPAKFDQLKESFSYIYH